MLLIPWQIVYIYSSKVLSDRFALKGDRLACHEVLLMRRYPIDIGNQLCQMVVASKLITQRPHMASSMEIQMPVRKFNFVNVFAAPFVGIIAIANVIE